MGDEKKNKKGLLSMIRDSLSKTGGCCGPGETCGGPSKNSDKATGKDKGSDKTEKK